MRFLGNDLICCDILAPFEGMNKTPMTCREFVDSLGAFLDEELTSPEHIRAQEHLTSCDKCSAYRRDYEWTVELAKKSGCNSAVSSVLPEDLVRKIIAGRHRS
jgi:predicted anti-sigma-YlaC factor YlaD